MEGIYSCANCHSASLDGKTLGMDIDGPQNDKGLYALAAIAPRMSIRNEDVIAWSTFRGKLGSKLRVGFMSQVSPDGHYVATTINDSAADQSDYQRRKRPEDLLSNYYVANFKDYRFLQVFFPTRGILAWYDRAGGNLKPLPGADDPRFVQTNGVWSPDGQYLVFSRAEAKDAYPQGTPPAARANDANETQIRYDLYRIPFNGGKGGKAEAIPGASRNGMSNSFPKVSPDGRWIVYVQARNGQLMRPDSQLYIVPAAGGATRRMRCNTPLMNSWHSFSPNGRWLVFSSKSRSPYTQMFLTHLDEAGNDSPAILIENTTAANRAVNIPEFLNIAPGGLLKIDAPATEFYRAADKASELVHAGRRDAAIAAWEEALRYGPGEAMAHYNLGNALSAVGRGGEAIAHYEKALELSPGHADALDNLGNALASQGKSAEAIAQYEKALTVSPGHANALTNLGVALARAGQFDRAIVLFRQAIETEPKHADAHNNLGLALAMSGKTEEAIPHLELAVEITQGRDALMLDLLGRAYAGTGRFPQAVAAARRALEVAERENNVKLIRALQGQIAAYESQAPLPNP